MKGNADRGLGDVILRRNRLDRFDRSKRQYKMIGSNDENELCLVVYRQFLRRTMNQDRFIFLADPQRPAIAAFLKVFGESVRVRIDFDSGAVSADRAFHNFLHLCYVGLNSITGSHYIRVSERRQ